MATKTRPRLSDEFLKANTRERILAGTAKAISRDGYRRTTVATIVRTCRVARNTFYDCFGGKEAAALALVAELGVELDGLSESPSLDALAIELAAIWRDGQEELARTSCSTAERIVRALDFADLADIGPNDDDPAQRALPPGRHNLPADFVFDNQRSRLYSGLAAAVAAKGWPATTIKDVCGHASVSRRTFYEHYLSLEALSGAVLVAALPDETLESLEDVPRFDPDRGLGAVAIEILAERLTLGRSPVAVAAIATLQAITERFG